ATAFLFLTFYFSSGALRSRLEIFYIIIKSTFARQKYFYRRLYKIMMKKFALLLAACFAICAITGCASRPTSNNTLVILSPHGREIQAEFERAFVAKHPDATIQWLDQGGSSTALRFADAQFEKQTDKDKGIGIDVYFGGGPETFLELEEKNLLQ